MSLMTAYVAPGMRARLCAITAVRPMLHHDLRGGGRRERRIMRDAVMGKRGERKRRTKHSAGEPNHGGGRNVDQLNIG